MKSISCLKTSKAEWSVSKSKLLRRFAAAISRACVSWRLRPETSSVRGLVLHNHDSLRPVSEKISGVPVSVLWAT